MKKLVAFTLIVAGASAYADSSRSIYDLMYLPKAGTAYGITEAQHNPWKLEASRGGTKIDYNESIATQTVGYSLSDMLSLSARIGYSYTKFDGPTHQTLDGVTDPVVNGRFRVMDGDYRLDVLVEGLISLGDNKIKSNEDGNALLGGHQLAAGAQFGQKFADYQWSVKGLLRRYFKATQDDKSTGVESENDAHLGLDFGADVLARLDDTNNVRAYASAIAEEEYEDDQDVNSPFKKTYGFGFEAQHLVSNDLMIRGGIGYSWIRQSPIKQWDTFNFTVAANYQF